MRFTGSLFVLVTFHKIRAIYLFFFSLKNFVKNEVYVRQLFELDKNWKKDIGSLRDSIRREEIGFARQERFRFSFYRAPN